MKEFVETVIKSYRCSASIESQLKSISFLIDYIKKQRYTIQHQVAICNHNTLSISEKEEIIKIIRTISAEIYSCCEIMNELFKNLYREDYRYRGTSLLNGFNSNFTKIYNANMKNGVLKGIHTDTDLNLFYYESAEWFIMFHDIRTQETHYEIGQIVLLDGKVMYLNNNRNGVSKSLYSNPSTEIYIEIRDVISLIDEFLKSKDKLCKIIGTCMICEQ